MRDSYITTIRAHINNLHGLSIARISAVACLLGMIVWSIVWFGGYFQKTAHHQEVLALIGGTLGLLYVFLTCMMIHITRNPSSTNTALDELLEERERKSNLISLLTTITRIGLNQGGKEVRDEILTVIISRITKSDLEDDDWVYDFLWKQGEPVRKLVSDKCQANIESAWSELTSYVETGTRPMNTGDIHNFTAEIDKLQSVIDNLQGRDNKFAFYSTDETL